MATKQRVAKVWIDEGCIVCDACETAAPTVFQVTDDTCVIRPEALKPEFTKPLTESIVDAAQECPVDVIKFTTVTEEVPNTEEPPAAAAAGNLEADPARTEARGSDADVARAKARGSDKTTTVTNEERQPEPAIAALLQAATTRGGRAGILRREESVPKAAQALRRKQARDLPPEARQTKILQAARKARRDPAERRAFMSNTALGVGWITFGTGATVSSTLAFVRFMMPNVLEEPDPRVRVGKMQRYLEMAPGDVVEDYKPQGIWMIRDGDRIAALNIICTHLGCIPNWLPNDRKFKCPCHGSGFKPDGINFEGPTPRPLERFRIHIEDGIVVVDKSKKYQYELGQWDQSGSFLEV